MKTNILILICLAVLVAAGTFAYKHIYENQVIILKDNQTVITKESWVVGDSLFYKGEDDIHSVNMDLVADIKQRGIFNKGYGIVVIVKHHGEVIRRLADLTETQRTIVRLLGIPPGGLRTFKRRCGM